MYTTRGALRRDLLRPEVYRAWRRSHFDGVDPLMEGPRVLSLSEVERIRDAEDVLLRAAEPYMSAITTAAGTASHAALLATASGVIIARRGDEESLSGKTPLPPIGALMGECDVGSNGLGTPLVENAYIELHGPEHFIRGFQGNHCFGIPIRGPDDELAGALCLSVRRPQTGLYLRNMLLIAAQGIESELRAERLRWRLAQLTEDASQAAKSVAMIHQDVVQSHAAARLQIQLGAWHLRNGRPGDIVHEAEASLARFMRGSRTWQLASGLHLADPMSLRELAENSVELMQTEAKMWRVELQLGRVEAMISQTAPVTPRLARLTLMETSHAMRAVGPEGRVEVHLLSDETLLFRGRSAQGSRRLDRCLR